MSTVKPSDQIVFNRVLLRLGRKRKGLTQEQLARKLDITVRQVNRWENGDGEPSAVNLNRLAKVLDLATSELYVIEQAA